MGKIILGEIELTPQQEVETVSGNVETVSGNVETLSSTTTAHTADTTAHVTAADKTKWNTVDNKLDTTAYTPTDLSNYYTKSETSGVTEISNALADKSDTGHTHTLANITDVTAPLAGINSITGAVGTMAFENASSYSSATEVNSALSGKSNTGHTHDDRYYTESELTGSSTTVVVAKAASATTAATAAVANSVALSNVSEADDIKAIEALTGTSGLLKKTAANTWSLDTTSYSSATQVNTALSGKSDTGHTHSQYLTGITSSQVTTALGYTPYNSTNPNGYTTNTGTVTSVAVKMNGSTKGTVTTSGTIDLGTVITSHQDISGKADKATTLAGYGITNAYTKTEIDNKIGDIETLLAAI